MIDEVTVLRLRAELAKAQEKERARIIEILRECAVVASSLEIGGTPAANAIHGFYADATKRIEESV